MELLQLKYFCRAAKCENFSNTAKEFQVPPSDISQSIHRLENELSVKLFDRSANKIKLNQCGRVFFENISEALSLIEKAKKEVKDSGEISGEIRILVEANRRIVTKAVEKFLNIHSNVSFYINNSHDDNTDNYDLIVSDRPLASKYFDRTPLVIEDILLAIEKSNPLAKKENLSVSALENERFVSMSSDSSICKMAVNICQSAGFVPNIAIQSNDPYYVRKYIEMGLGIAFVPAVSWGEMISENVILRNITNVKRTTYVYNEREKYLSNAVKEFLKVLTDEKF